jgi:hypothetical protein
LPPTREAFVDQPQKTSGPKEEQLFAAGAESPLKGAAEESGNMRSYPNSFSCTHPSLGKKLLFLVRRFLLKLFTAKKAFPSQQVMQA